MSRRKRISGLCLWLGLVAAVSFPAVADEAVADPDATVAPLVADGDFHAFDSQLSWLIATLLENNPRIRAANERWRADVARVPQANAFPDPMVTYRYFVDTPETRVGPQVQGLEISQELPWLGKRDLDEQRATHIASGVEWQVRQLSRGLVSDLKRAYFDLAYLQEALAINVEESELLRRFENSALARYAAGEGIQQSVLQVQTEISRLSDRGSLLRQQLRSTVRQIAHLIGRPDATLSVEPIRLALPDLQYDPSDLEVEALQGHPTVQALTQRIEADEIWSRKRKLEGRPDFKVGVGYVDVHRREDSAGMLNPPEDNGKDIFSVSVGVRIPLYREKVRGGVAEAEQSVRAGESSLASARDRLRFEIQETTLRLDSLEDRARFFEEVIIPQAEESLASAEAAYRTNRQDFLDLLEAERVLFQVRLTHQRLLADVWVALADLELELGRSFPGGRG